MSIIFTILLLFLISLQTAFLSVNPSLCANYYDQYNILCQGAQSPQCIFAQGLQQLVILPQNASHTYSLCLNLPSYQLEVSNAIDSFNSSLYIYSLLLFYYNCTTTTPSQIIFDVLSTTHILQSKIYCKSLIINSDTLTISSSSVVNESSPQSPYTCSPQNPPTSNPTTALLSLTAEQSLHISSSILRSPSLLIHSANTTISESTLSSDGLGYPSLTGPGCGFFDAVSNEMLGCSGTGGSHGGAGGASTCPQLVSELPYDDETEPWLPGSGAGFALKDIKTYSSGGGVIRIKSTNIVIDRSFLFANGSRGVQEGGGGAGGTISLDYEVGLLLDAYIGAQGGGGKSSGGGGRVRLWEEKRGNSSTKSVRSSIHVEGGECDGGGCGGRGSIIVQPCGQGYTINNYLCVKCPLGEYKSVTGYAQCFPCGNAPQNGVYVEGKGHSYEEACVYQCEEGYYLKEKLCLGEWDYIFYFIGGGSVMVCILIFVIALILFGIILCGIRVKNIMQQNL